MRCSVFIATSLDGFIARPDGDIDWLSGGSFDGPDEDYGYKAFIATVDTIVMGRGTFEKVLTFGSWPYGVMPVVVLSSRGVVIPEAISGTVRDTSGTPAEVVAELERAGVKRAYVDGGVTIQRFLAAGKIDDLTITRIPVLLGAGLPLFGAVPHDVRLTHVSTRAFPSGLVQSRYEALRASQGP